MVLSSLFVVNIINKQLSIAQLNSPHLNVNFTDLLWCWCVSKFVKSHPLEIILATENNLGRVAQIIHSWQAFWPCPPLQWKGGHWLWFDNCNVCCDMFSNVFWFSLLLCATHFNRHLTSGNNHENRYLLLFYSKMCVNLFVLFKNCILLFQMITI